MSAEENFSGGDPYNGTPASSTHILHHRSSQRQSAAAAGSGVAGDDVDNGVASVCFVVVFSLPCSVNIVQHTAKGQIKWNEAKFYTAF